MKISKYGVPSKLPDGRDNPEYTAARRRAKGITSRPENWGKLGIPERLPDGTRNPKYAEARRRSQGIGPRRSAGFGKYGIPSKLSDGRRNPEYDKMWLKEHLLNPRAVHARGGKYGVPSHLPNGKINPDWTEAVRRSKGILPKQSSKSGISAYINGSPNPEYYIYYYKEIRAIVFSYYSKNKIPQCADPYGIHSEENHVWNIEDALELDHIADDGRYQVLCHNCQNIKRVRNEEIKC